MLEFIAVSKQFPDGQVALDDINLKIEGSEFVFITGRSGAGKSTLLKLITKELVPTSGQVMFNEDDIAKIPENKLHILRRRVGTVFQDFKLLLNRTVFENVALSLEVLKKSDSEIEKEVAEALEKVGILEKADYFPAQLSGGEVQRTAIARAIVSKPEVLLADEPTGDLDPKTAESVVELLEKISKDGTTVLMATHNSTIVNKFKKRVVTLKKGKIEKDQKEGKYESD